MEPEKFRRAVHSHAKHHRLTSVTRLVEDPKAIEIQFFPRISEDPGE